MNLTWARYRGHANTALEYALRMPQHDVLERQLGAILDCKLEQVDKEAEVRPPTDHSPVQ